MLTYRRDGEKEDMIMIRVEIAALTSMGSHVYTELKMNEGYTMNQLVAEVKRQGFIAFRILDTMKTYVYI